MSKEMLSRLTAKQLTGDVPTFLPPRLCLRAQHASDVPRLSRWNAALLDLFAAEDALLAHHLKRQTLDDGPVKGALASVNWGKALTGTRLHKR